MVKGMKVLLMVILVFVVVTAFQLWNCEARAESSMVMYCTGNNVNERKANNTKAANVRKHEKGERIHVVAEEGGWYQLTNGHWMSGDYLATAEEAGDWIVINSFEYMYVRASILNVRTGPSTRYDKSYELKAGTRVKVLSIERGWALLEGGGYVNADYLSFTPEEVMKYYMKKYDDLIVISISNQYSFYSYEGEIIGSADVVTGKDITPTPTGLYTVRYRDTDCYLMENSFVRYFTAFVGGIGIHDASWRTTFGGTRYHNHGSHGCVNTTLSYAELVYNTSREGKTRVLVVS